MSKTTENSLHGMGKKLLGNARGFLLVAALAFAVPAAGAAETETLFAPFAALLESSVQDGQVTYADFAQSTAYASMINRLGKERLPASASSDERLATYINAYNALSIQGILDGFSPSSIFSRLKFFKRRQYEVFGTSMTLYELEHENIISAGDPRIHFAIVCSSKSCPPLINTLYSADTLDAQLNAVTADFINNSQSNRFDLKRKQADLSRIFKWYGDEFEAEAGSLAQFLARYVTDDALKASLQTDDWDFDYLDYDWSLNGTSPE
ncbi:MAG: DUF547 domain-containing protein [Woeseiaceae bacterium]